MGVLHALLMFEQFFKDTINMFRPPGIARLQLLWYLRLVTLCTMFSAWASDQACFVFENDQVSAGAHSSSFTSLLESSLSGFDASKVGGVASAISTFSPNMRAVNCLASLSKSTHSGTILLAP